MVCHNMLVGARQRVQEGWSGITVQLKRRHVLVANLVDAARSAMTHETAILDRILEARTRALDALARSDQAAVTEAEAALSDALGRFVAYAEDNALVTATATIALLRKQVEETEDQIAAARRLVNGNVQAHNTRALSIPRSVVARLNRFEPAAMFAVDPVEMKKPRPIHQSRGSASAGSIDDCTACRSPDRFMTGYAVVEKTKITSKCGVDRTDSIG